MRGSARGEYPAMTTLANAPALHDHEDAAMNLNAAQEIDELRHELRTSLAFTCDLTQENAALRKQTQDADALSKVWQQRHAEWKDVWRKERESLLDREKKLEQEEAKLETQRRELQLSESRQQAVNNNNGEESGAHLEVLKKVQAEHAAKTERLVQEASQWREKFYITSKEHEGVLAENKVLQDQVDRERDVAEAFQKEIASLQEAFAARIEDSKKSNASSASSEALVRELKLKLEEKELELEKLQQEVKEKQKAKDATVLLKDEAAVSHQAELGRTIRERATHEANAQALEKQLQSAKKEANSASSSKAELGESLKRTQKELERLQEIMTSKEERFAQETEKLRLSLAQSETQLKKQLMEAEAAFADEQAKTKELERRCLDTHEKALKQIAVLSDDLKRDDCSEKLLAAQDQIVRLENACSSLQSQMKRLAVDQIAEVQRLQHACETVHKDLNIVLLEKKDTDKSAASERNKVARGRKELEQAEQLLLQQEEKLQLLADDKIKLAQEVEGLRSDNSLLGRKAKAASDRERDADALRGEVEKVSIQQLAKEKRRSNAYKGKALEAHRRSQEAKEVLHTLTGSFK
ncbi:hypothetical protein ACHAXT_010505 [Thalassiosira profunda]